MNTTALANPPAYHTLTALENSTSTSLPRYSRRPISGSTTIYTQSSVHEFLFAKRNGLVLRVYGDANLSQRLPTFMEGGSISGTVNIGPKLGKRINIKISVRGRILLGHGGDYRDGTVHTFLRLSVHLPPPVSVDYSATFCIPLPREVLVSSGRRDSAEVVKLPSSFAEPKFPVRVVYDLVLKVKRKWWQQDIKTFLGYSQGSTRPISSPVSCHGWQTLEPVMLKGTIFSEREVEVHYTLSLSKPVSYATIVVVPFTAI
ncbi:hypothetical protein VNI00_013279 [Paramarasmius palmivorus]|uniref:Arrestin-like N-terminal domain-containing protein n=1 Tax=Paramarasmius palmivorus TaxID=297713 RepID=A0AAW0C065_9AGAR